MNSNNSKTNWNIYKKYWNWIRDYKSNIFTCNFRGTYFESNDAKVFLDSSVASMIPRSSRLLILYGFYHENYNDKTIIVI